MDSNTSAATAPAPEKDLTEAEIALAKTFLTQTIDEIIGAIQGVTPEQWNFKPAPESWSIAQIVEHITTVNARVHGPMQEALASAPPAPAGHDPAKIDMMVIHRFPARLAKFEAPDGVRPLGDYTIAEAREHLAADRARFIRILENTPDLRRHAIEAPPLKAVSNGEYHAMDGYQWILAALAHAQRHTHQILEVRANPAFPES